MTKKKPTTAKKKRTKKKTGKKLEKSSYTSEEWDWPQDAQKSNVAWPKKTRLEYIKSLFSRGILDPSKKDLAAMTGVSKSQMYEDFKEVYASGISLKEVKDAETILGNALKNGIIEASQVIIEAGKDKKLKLHALKTMAEVGEKYVDFLEKFDIKKPGEIDQTDNELIIKWEQPMKSKK